MSYIIKLKNVQKSYKMGDSEVYALRGVNLEIEEGDFVAIMGPSGSGKSTLMHVLGLLDVPSSGSYQLQGTEVAHLSEDQLSICRRDSIGFIFQQFNLLPRMPAVENVSLPLLYSKGRHDFERAKMLLEKVALGNRFFHRTNELSGGQQQRVAIARSLINQPHIILADEPTGNLDSTSEKEIMTALKDLNAQGISILIVTHEEEIGQQAKRLIRMRDGAIISDERILPIQKKEISADSKKLQISRPSLLLDIWEHFKQGVHTLGANKVRTALSMLGILIGVAAVVAMLALGKGAQNAIEAQLASLGSNLLVLRPGAIQVGGVLRDAGSVTRLTNEDARDLKDKILTVKESSPSVSGRAQITFSSKNWSTQILGTGPSYAVMHASEPLVGRFFTEEENQKRSRVAVIGMTLVKQLFGEINPIGESIKINKVIFQVIGVLPAKGATGWRDQDDIVIVPCLTAMHRLLGKEYVDYIDIEVNSAGEVDDTQDAILDLMQARHKIPLSQRSEAFQIRNMADIKDALSQSSKTMSALLAVIAAISLLVGGIGIMNIMLVSVTERTREIGLRKAVGARRKDILLQFLVESVVVSMTGGLAGILLGWLITLILSAATGWSTSVSPTAIFLSFFFSTSIGIVFGIYPARKASLLSPIEALRYE